MENLYNIEMLDKRIKELKKIAEEIKESGGQIEAVKRNINRILASIKMLEINICDLTEV
ncbi:MAG: hypothetical protein N2745_00190 [Syntrophorhabdaceae bacterium]|nr:hypothetical protein [Syntrophorhabdaceae bacterium]